MKRSNYPILPICNESSEINYIVDNEAETTTTTTTTSIPIPTIATEDDGTQQWLLPTHKPTIHEKKQARVIHSANLMASFFGMLPLQEGDMTANQQISTISQTNNYKVTTYNNATTPIKLMPPTTLPILKSAPISFSPQKQPQRNNSENSLDTTQTRLPPPPSNVIDKDGHVWRAKYCILQDGMLYFYNNMVDATSDDATIERRNKSNLSMEGPPQALSRSPLPRKGIWKQTTMGDTLRTENVLWEKRVLLDQVGVVRSAEVEYGPWSFELLAIPEDENENVTSDKLVLRAKNSEEMNEWLFQFHRSLASLMKNIVQAFGLASSIPTANVMLDLGQHHSSIHSRIMMIPPASPQLKKQISSNLSTSLSHGHGRSGMHRRRRSIDDTTLTQNTVIVTDQNISTSSTESHESSLPFPLEITILRPLMTKQSSSMTILDSAVLSQTKRPIPVKPGVEKCIPPQLGKTVSDKKSTPYILPHLRKKAQQGTSLEDSSNKTEEKGIGRAFITTVATVLKIDEPVDPNARNSPPSIFGGCADPAVAYASIMDPMYKGRSASTVTRDIAKAHTEALGCFGGGSLTQDSALQWEIGAISECGIRKSLEDSYLICNDLILAFQDLPGADVGITPMWSQSNHTPGVFAIFDGHCGNQASRYAAEKLTQYIREESNAQSMESPCTSQNVSLVLEHAIQKLDDDFCRICDEENRDWESGTTALVVAIANGHLVVANLGDCRAVLCRSVDVDRLDDTIKDQLQGDGWTQDDDTMAHGEETTYDHKPGGRVSSRCCFWKEVADVHSPSRGDEQIRIEAANGWVTTEFEIPIGQLRRIDFCDEDVVEILVRCFHDRIQTPQSLSGSKKACNAAPERIVDISRVCGELGVSRAVGDRDFKAAYNTTVTDVSINETPWWKCSLPLPYSDEHSQKFQGDLVSSIPEMQTIKISQSGEIDEFLLLACDGLWDVMDPDDAVRIIRSLLFQKKWPAKKAAARLVEIAIHLGSSDNITVIAIRFFTSQ